MATYLEHFKMAYTQTTLEFGSADIFTDASGDGLERTASFVLLMKLATRGGKEDHVRGALVVAPPREVQVQCDQISIEEAVRFRPRNHRTNGFTSAKPQTPPHQVRRLS